MLKRLKQSLAQLGFQEPGKPVLVGVSGGADSLALLFLLHSAGYPVIAAYFNHSLRESAEDEARQVGETASRLGVPFMHEKQDVRQHARKHGLSIEAAGRALRYRFLFDQARQHSARAVAVAHHADDQVETVLLHLLRGSGMQGLQGMSSFWLPNPWSDEIPLVRPLLTFWKSELEAYLQDLGVQSLQDETNLDSTYLRNRLRHEVIPYLEQIQPGLRPALLRLSQIVQDEQVLLEPLLEPAWEGCLHRQGEDFIILSASGLNAQPAGLQRRICRRALAVLRPGLPDIDFNAVERMVGFVQASPKSRQLDLVSGLRLLREGDDLWLADWGASLPVDTWPQLPKGESCLVLQVPQQVDLPDGWYLICTLEEDVSSAARLAADNTDPFQAWLDLDQSGAELQLRRRWNGARFQPLGLNGQTQKVSDRMIDAHIPARARDGWPLLCAGQRILWIPGLAVAHSARLTEITKRVLHFTLQKRAGI